MAKKTIKKELIGAQDLYNFLFEVCNIDDSAESVPCVAL